MPILDPGQNHEISLQEAIEMTDRHRTSSSFSGLNGGFFGKSAILEIPDQIDSVGLRYYYGLNTSNAPVLVLVGVTMDNVDLVNGKLAELSLPCPDICDANSPLKGS